MTEFLPFAPLAQPRRVAQLTPEVVGFKAFKVKALETEASRVVNLAFCPTAPHRLAVVTGTKIGLWKCGQEGLEADGNITKFKDVTQCVAWRSDGRLLLAGEASGSCAVIEADTKKVLRRFRGHNDAVTCAAFATADKTRAATGSRDGKLRLWDVVTGDLAQTVPAHTDVMKFVATGAGGSGDTWITAGYDGQAKLWDLRMSVADSTPAASFQVDHGHPIEAAVAFPSGTLLITAGGPEVKVWDFTMSGRLVQGIPDAHSKAVTAVCLDSTASVLLTASFDGYAKVFSAAGLEHLYSWKQSAPVTCAAWRPDDRVFALGLDSGKWGYRLRKLEEDQAAELKQAMAKKQAKKPWAWQHGKMRGTDAQPASDDEIVQPRKMRRKDSKIDFFFKKFEYRKLGELMFQTNVTDGSGLGIAEELVQRQGLPDALADRDEEFCTRALMWLSKIFKGGGDILRQQLVMEVIHTLIDTNKCLQPPANPKVLFAFTQLERKVGREMSIQESLTETKSMLEAVLNL